MNNFLCTYRIWLCDRELNTVSCFTVGTLAHDIYERALELKIEHTDTEYVCFRVDFIEIYYFQIGGVDHDDR